MKPRRAFQEKARFLRAKGYSYTEICKVIPVSKSSISLWCRSVHLSVSKQRRLTNRAHEGALRGRKKWAEMRRVSKQQLLKRLAIQTQRDVGKLSKRDNFIAGLMLYAGEGDRTGERIGISNSNPEIIQFMADWFEEFLGFDRVSFKVHLYLHVGLSEKGAKAFWEKALRISGQQIVYVYRPVPRRSHKGNVHSFGICSVRIHNKMAHRHIMGWIRAVLSYKNYNIPR